jgi:hypothetical protein
MLEDERRDDVCVLDIRVPKEPQPPGQPVRDSSARRVSSP